MTGPTLHCSNASHRCAALCAVCAELQQPLGSVKALLQDGGVEDSPPLHSIPRIYVKPDGVQLVHHLDTVAFRRSMLRAARQKALSARATRETHNFAVVLTKSLYPSLCSGVSSAWRFRPSKSDILLRLTKRTPAAWYAACGIQIITNEAPKNLAHADRSTKAMSAPKCACIRQTRRRRLWSETCLHLRVAHSCASFSTDHSSEAHGSTASA